MHKTYRVTRHLLPYVALCCNQFGEGPILLVAIAQAGQGNSTN